jgi:hypothetical protein
MVHCFPNDGAAATWRKDCFAGRPAALDENCSSVARGYFDCASYFLKIDANCGSIPVKVSPIPRLGTKISHRRRRFNEVSSL